MTKQNDLIQDEGDNPEQTAQLQSYYAASPEDSQSLLNIHSRLLLQNREQVQPQPHTQNIPTILTGQFTERPTHKRDSRRIWQYIAIAAILCIASASSIFIILMRNNVHSAQQPNIPPVSITSLQMTSPTTGWGIGVSPSAQSDIFVRTTDSGKNWQEFHFTNQPTGVITNFVLNDQTAWIIPGIAKYTTTTTPLLYTDDGGQHWQTYTIPSKVSDITFVDQQHGWAWNSDSGQRANTLLQTINGGQTWTQFTPIIGIPTHPSKSFPTLPSKSSPMTITSLLTFVTPQIGWAVTNHCLYRTDDGGKSWIMQQLPGQDQIKQGFPQKFDSVGFVSMALPKFQDMKHGLITVYTQISGSNEFILIYATTDGGQTWTMQGPLINLDSTMLPAQSITIIDATHIAIPENKSIHIYSLTNHQWQESARTSFTGVITSVNFINSQTGWLQTQQSGGNGKTTNTFYETRNGGKTWSEFIK